MKRIVLEFPSKNKCIASFEGDFVPIDMTYARITLGRGFRDYVNKLRSKQNADTRRIGSTVPADAGKVE